MGLPFRSCLKLHVHVGRCRFHNPGSDPHLGNAQAEPDDAADYRIWLFANLFLVLLDFHEDEVARLPSKLIRIIV